jgi:hypothetical protein
MNREDAIRWILYLCCPFIRRSQAKILSVLACAAMALEWVCLAQCGRVLAAQVGTACKHAIKRVDRFVGNPRIEPIEAMRGIVQWLAQPRRQLLVSLDWVDLRGFQCLVLAARLHRRAIPLLWAVYRYEDIYKSQNNFEYGLLHAFRTMVPKSTQVVLLADRGFGRAEMARQCQTLGLGYILRIQPKVFLRNRRFHGLLKDWPIRRGQSTLLRNVEYRKQDPVRCHVAIVWRPEQEEPWYLLTNREGIPARRLWKVFAQRMSIEEYFRDTKSCRNGFAVRLIQIRDSQRLSRFLLVLAWAYILLVALGLYASKRFRPSQWCSNNRLGECSLFTIGKAMLHRILPSVTHLTRHLRAELLSPNWG